VITDSNGSRLTVIGWTGGAGDSRVGIHRLGVGAVLTFDIEQARELAEDLTRWVGMVRRAASELREPEEPIGGRAGKGFCGPQEWLTPHETEHVVFGQPRTDLPKSVGQQAKGTRR